jgi:phage shock protein E
MNSETEETRMSSMVLGLILVVAAVGVLAFMVSRNASTGEIGAALDAGATVVDVRSHGEFRAGHFPGAINIPVDQISAQLKKLGDPEKPVILYCHSGIRSGSAMHIVKRAGFKKAINARTLGRLKRAAGKD